MCGRFPQHKRKKPHAIAETLLIPALQRDNENHFGPRRYY
jgi:hypothetical protein